MKVVDVQSVKIPVFARILTVQTQNDLPQLWVLCDESEDVERRTFVTYGTGRRMSEDPGEYVGTYQMLGGSLVYHVFEKR